MRIYRGINIGNEEGQAMMELAVFGSIVLIVFGILLAYMQQFNNQQYVAMETFRRALEKAYNAPSTSGGAGASVQYTNMQTRRQIDLSGPFRKGAPSTISASANVFWAIPKVDKDAEPENLIVIRVNEDEKQDRYRNYVAKPAKNDEEETSSFRTEEAQTSVENSITERISKNEDPISISNTKSSNMTETLKTVIPYVVTKKEAVDDYDDSNDVILKKGTFFEVKQGLYVDPADGQYKYKEEKKDEVTERARQWETEF